MKHKTRMTPDELRSYVASEVESIRTDIERLKFTAQHVDGLAGSLPTNEARSAADDSSLTLQRSLPGQHRE